MQWNGISWIKSKDPSPPGFASSYRVKKKIHFTHVFELFPGPCHAFSHFAVPSYIPFTSCIRLDQTVWIGAFAGQYTHLFSCLTHTMYSSYVLCINLSWYDSLGLSQVFIPGCSRLGKAIHVSISLQALSLLFFGHDLKDLIILLWIYKKEGPHIHVQ